MPLEQKLEPANPFARHDPWGAVQKRPLRLTPSPTFAARLAPPRTEPASRPEKSAPSRPSQGILTGSALPPPRPPGPPVAKEVVTADGAATQITPKAPDPPPIMRAAAPVSDARSLRTTPNRRLNLFGATLAGIGLLGLAAVAFGVMVATRPTAPPAVKSRAAILTAPRPPAPISEALEPGGSDGHPEGVAPAPTKSAPGARKSTIERNGRLAHQAPAPAQHEAPLPLAPPEPFVPTPNIVAETPPTPQPEPLSDPEAPMAKRRSDTP